MNHAARLLAAFPEWFNVGVLLLIALAIPFGLWPWATARLFQRLEMPFAAVLGASSGPLWFGWLLGALVLVTPGLPVWAYGIFLVGSAAVLAAVGRPLPRPAVRPEVWTLLAAVACIAAVSAAVFLTVAFPPADHDVLIVDVFSRHLSEGWNYWALPRYQPDARGFYYPLSHPPGMMSILAWLYAFGADGWLQRVPSAYLLGAFYASLGCAASRIVKGSAPLAIAILFTAPLFLQFTTGNSQDVFRYAAFAAGLLALSAVGPRLRNAPVVAGALLGLAAAFHALQVPFVLLVPIAYAAAGGFRREAMRTSAVMLGAGAITGAYPYLSAYAHLGKFLVPTSSGNAIPIVDRFLRDLISSYAAVDADWTAVSLARLQVLLPTQSGLIGAAFLASLMVLAAIRRARPEETAQRRAVVAVAVASSLFLLLVLDPGNLVLRFAKTAFWNNVRYPQTVFPLMAVVFAAVAARLLRLAGRLNGPLVLVISGALLWRAVPALSWDTKQYAEPEQACVWCSDAAKRTANRGSGAFRATSWLELQPDRRCLTFREGEYFSFSQRLQGTPYYSLASERALMAPDGAAVRRSLALDGLNCVFVDGEGALRDALEKRSPGFASLATHPTVIPLSFYEIQVWLLDEQPPMYAILANAITPAPTQATATSLPGPGLYAVSATIASAGPATVVAAVNDGRRSDRVFLRNAQNPGQLAFSFATAERAQKLQFWFSQPVTLTGFTLRRIERSR